MNKRLVGILLLVVQCIVYLSSCAYAESVLPCADEVFSEATIVLYKGKYVTYTASSVYTLASIAVTSAHLEVKVDGEWTFVCNLTCPPSRTNTFDFTHTMYYTDQISTGTYRVVATFTADGHSITRTSNERTY